MSKDGQQILIINANTYRYDASILFLKSQNREEFLNRCLFSRGDHFEMKFIVKYCKFVKRLVKIGTFEPPNPNFGPTSPQVPALLPR